MRVSLKWILDLMKHTTVEPAKVEPAKVEPASPVALPSAFVQKWTRPTYDSMVDLPQAAVRFMQNESKCPYCHSNIFEGPSGGMSMNVFCGNPDCDSRFNIVLGGIPWGQFTGTCPEDFLEQRRKQIAQEKTDAPEANYA